MDNQVHHEESGKRKQKMNDYRKRWENEHYDKDLHQQILPVVAAFLRDLRHGALYPLALATPVAEILV